MCNCTFLSGAAGLNLNNFQKRWKGEYFFGDNSFKRHIYMQHLISQPPPPLSLSLSIQVAFSPACFKMISVLLETACNLHVKIFYWDGETRHNNALRKKIINGRTELLKKNYCFFQKNTDATWRKTRIEKAITADVLFLIFCRLFVKRK